MLDSKKCVYCNQEAKYYCTCMNPNIYFCSRDRETHEASPGDHPIRLNKPVDIFKPNPIFKRNLIQEILKSRLSAEAQVNNVIKASAKMIELITKETKETMVKLHRFVSLCNDILNQIYSIELITPKQMYCPIEALLLFEDAENAISKIKSPAVEIAEIPNLFSYIPTTFPHFLYNFAETSIEVPGFKGKIQISNPIKVIEHEKFHCTSQYLNLQNKKILITGGSLDDENGTADAFILDIVSESLIKLPHLINPRRRHSMAWINGAPSVIGGYNQGKSISSVEVFTNNAWVKTESLNIPRNGATSLSFLDAVWTIGGFNIRYLDSIEKYKQRKWVVLSIRLPFPRKHIGFICIDSCFLLIGGFNETKEEKRFNDVFVVNNNWSSIQKAACLTVPMTFLYNQFHVRINDIVAMGTNNSSKIAIEIIKISSIKL